MKIRLITFTPDNDHDATGHKTLAQALNSMLEHAVAAFKVRYNQNKHVTFVGHTAINTLWHSNIWLLLDLVCEEQVWKTLVDNITTSRISGNGRAPAEPFNCLDYYGQLQR